jgi:GxxExxY protein
MNLVILISNTGTGTNLKAIIDGVNSKKINASIKAVICDKPDAPALLHARDNNLPIIICPKKEGLLPLLKTLDVDYICLAGWKQIILNEVIIEFPNKILNLHPGLIPDTVDGFVECPDGSMGLWNKSMLANKAIQNFFDQKATYAGSSIHYLTLEFDFGPVLGRCFEKIEADDTVESLYTRLKQKENDMYVNVLNKLAEPSTKNEKDEIRNKYTVQKADLIYKDECFKIVSLLFKIYKEKGGSFQEKHYQKFIAELLKQEGINFSEQVPVKIEFAGKSLGVFYIDFLIKIGDAKIILEIKKHENFGPKNIDQVMSYLKATNLPLGILANFTHSGVKFKRIINLN